LQHVSADEAAALNGTQVPINGATRLYAIIGDPIAQVKSPQVLNPRFAAAGLNAVLFPVHVKPELFDETVRGLMAIANLDGIIATVPYKARIIPFIGNVLPMAAKVGAANALRRGPDGSWSGDMFDGRGLVRGLRDASIPLEGRRVMLVGAGGAGSAAGRCGGGRCGGGRHDDLRRRAWQGASLGGSRRNGVSGLFRTRRSCWHPRSRPADQCNAHWYGRR
jgi:hypothetical protein